MDVESILVTVLMHHLLIWQLLQMQSEPAWGPKAWTRWSVTDFWSQSQAYFTLPLLGTQDSEAGVAVCFRSRMRKVTWSLPTMEPPSWSRCRCSTLQPKWYVPIDAAWFFYCSGSKTWALIWFLSWMICSSFQWYLISSNLAWNLCVYLSWWNYPKPRTLRLVTAPPLWLWLPGRCWTPATGCCRKVRAAHDRKNIKFK